MKEVNIYTQTKFKGIRKQNVAAGYVISTQTSKGEATASDIQYLLNETPNQAEIEILISALERMKHPCELTIWTNSFYIQSGIEKWMETWKKNNWCAAKGKEISNADEWKRVEMLLKPHKVKVRVGEEHPYRAWLKSAVENKRNESDS